MKTSAKTLLITAAMTELRSASVPAFASAHTSTTQDDNIGISKTSAKSGTASSSPMTSRVTSMPAKARATVRVALDFTFAGSGIAGSDPGTTD